MSTILAYSKRLGIRGLLFVHHRNRRYWRHMHAGFVRSPGGRLRCTVLRVHVEWGFLLRHVHVQVGLNFMLIIKLMLIIYGVLVYILCIKDYRSCGRFLAVCLTRFRNYKNKVIQLILCWLLIKHLMLWQTLLY